MKRCSTATPHAARLEPHESNTPTTARHPCLLRAFPAYRARQDWFGCRLGGPPRTGKQVSRFRSFCETGGIASLALRA